MSKRETVEEFLARGGKIQFLEPHESGIKDGLVGDALEMVIARRRGAKKGGEAFAQKQIPAPK